MSDSEFVKHVRVAASQVGDHHARSQKFGEHSWRDSSGRSVEVSPISFEAQTLRCWDDYSLIDFVGPPTLRGIVCADLLNDKCPLAHLPPYQTSRPVARV